MTNGQNTVTLKGEALVLAGRRPAVGDAAPDAAVLGNDLTEVRLSSYNGRVRVLSSVPSLDTPVCHAETRRFNELAGALGVPVLTISMDLPFAQKRWCAAEGIENVRTLSDHRDGAFGRAYGVLIERLRLLARCVFVVGPDDRIAYVQLVGEVTEEPDYEGVLKAVKALR